MPENSGVKPELEPKASRRAKKEAAEIAAGTLRRQEKVQTHLYWAGLLLFWLLIAVMSLLGLVWAWHMGTPLRLHFLTSEQLSELQRFLLAVIGSSSATQLSNRWLGTKSKRLLSE